jgi:hypothetical protein
VKKKEKREENAFKSEKRRKATEVGITRSIARVSQPASFLLLPTRPGSAGRLTALVTG